MCPALVLIGICFALMMLSGWVLFALINSDLRHLRRTAAARPVAVPPLVDHHPPLADDIVIELTPKQRGEELLLRLLSPSQRSEYERHGIITVPITATGSKYAHAQISRRHRGVTWIPPGEADKQPRYEQCVYITPRCPQSDAVLIKADDLIAKLLWLRSDPAGLARVSGLVLCPRLFPEWVRTTDAPI